MGQNNKLELTWVGKEDRPRLEPRILIEDSTYSFHADKRHEGDIFDNLLIQGDNLLALKALQSTHSGLVKCIYIDPPYNINVASPHYEDGLEHSSWLSLMRERLELLKQLLADDGMIFVQIDDEEFSYLQILMDEVFGRSNRVNTICVKMSEASGVKMAHTEKRLPKLKEYILAYRKLRTPPISVDLVPVGEWNEEYKTVLDGLSREEVSELKSLLKSTEVDSEIIARCNQILRAGKLISVSEFAKAKGIGKNDLVQWRFDNAWRIVQAVGSSSVLRLAMNAPRMSQDVAAVESTTGVIYLYKTDFDREAKQPRIQIIFADENLFRNPGDFWQDIKTTGGVGQEGGVLFPNGKKPEKLIWRIINMCTKPGDLVLDSFAGSGTTGAVAHKMGRRWIMVELGDHATSHIIPRLRKVIGGTDQSGVTELVGWQGGGGFRFCRLAPSLLQKDRWNNWVISKEYNPAMLAEAMCKHMGFTYAPSQDPAEYWNHGHSSERDFIFVTTNALTHKMLEAISYDVGPDRHLLICCKAFSTERADAFENLTLRKIPHAILDTCEWGRDDYSLRIASLPVVDRDVSDDDVQTDAKPKKKRSKGESQDEPTLFGETADVEG